MAECGTLVFFCGKMAAGKSTKAEAYATEQKAVLLSEDEWLNALYPEQVKTLKDYVKYSSLLKTVLQTHVQNILRCGGDVVMDFPGNTQQQRQWFLEIAQSAGALHQMFYLDLSDEQCLVQLQQRRFDSPERSNFDTADNFRLITSFFEPPMQHEAINIEVIRA